ncbi:hypothetical protein [Ascidiimonas aurantiaca]|uniref:hypothetical protein n=1 Tax=Ascidiimonas aurantiaca TaxID=1685432 RepID=UPI0030ED71EA
MELDEMKNVWSEMAEQLEQQKQLTNEMILKMTQLQFKDRLSRIAIPEVLSSIVCFVAGFYLLANLSKLDTLSYRIMAMVSIGILIILPIWSLTTIKRMKRISPLKLTYKETLLAFAKGKKQFVFAQKLSMYLGFVLMFTLAPVMAKILLGKDLEINQKLLWFIPVGILLFVLFTRWVMRCYQNVLRDADAILEDLKSD